MHYRYETHCHCSQCSRCAISDSRSLVLAYHRAGYAGLVLTDHFVLGNTAVDTSLPWQEQIECYRRAYLNAKAAAEPLDFDVIFGIEHAYGYGQEVLCYGIEPEFLLDNPDIPRLSIEEFIDRVHAAGGIVIQAHPYRYGGWEIPVRMDILDGVEVHNAGNPPIKNDMATQKASGRDCIRTSGGDIHWASNVNLGLAGVALPYRVCDSRTFADALKRGDHRLIIQGQIQEDV